MYHIHIIQIFNGHNFYRLTNFSIFIFVDLSFFTQVAYSIELSLIIFKDEKFAVGLSLRIAYYAFKQCSKPRPIILNNMLDYAL